MRFSLHLFLALGLLLTAGAADPKPITVAVGQNFQISLPSNATTGYQWQFAKPPDAKLLRVLSAGYKRPESKLVGVGGAQVWSFKAVAKGETTLALNYLRPWETNSPPAQSTNFVVVIQSPNANAKAKAQDPKGP